MVTSDALCFVSVEHESLSARMSGTMQIPGVTRRGISHRKGARIDRDVGRRRALSASVSANNRDSIESEYECWEGMIYAPNGH